MAASRRASVARMTFGRCGAVSLTGESRIEVHRRVRRRRFGEEVAIWNQAVSTMPKA